MTTISRTERIGIYPGTFDPITKGHLHIIKRASKLEFSITIGNENQDEMFKDCSIVTATYQVGDEPLGSFGIIGPTRMNYSKVISVLEYMRRSLSEVLSADQDDE